jgi:hypothetical protein
MFSPSTAPDEDSPEDSKKSMAKKKNKAHPAQNPQSAVLKGTLVALKGLHGKLHGDLAFGKRESAWGKLGAKDMDEIFTLFRGILIPLIGMGTITDIFERIAERRGWVDVASDSKYDKAESWEPCGNEAKEREKKTWNEIMKTLHEPFANVRFSSFMSRNAKLMDRMLTLLIAYCCYGRRPGTYWFSARTTSQTEGQEKRGGC